MTGQKGQTAGATQAEVARRVKAARENCGLTQQQVAEAIAVPRTAVVQIEAGNRAVSSLELSRLARLFGRGMEEFLSEEPFKEDAMPALFRTTSALSDEPALGTELGHCVALC